MTFSITGSQIFLADFVIFTKSERKTAYRFIVHTTSCKCIYLSQFKCRGHIHKRDQAQVEPNISSSLGWTALNLRWFFAQFELDPFCEYQPWKQHLHFTKTPIYEIYVRAVTSFLSLAFCRICVRFLRSTALLPTVCLSAGRDTASFCM